jgi:hypothetical protein
VLLKGIVLATTSLLSRFSQYAFDMQTLTWHKHQMCRTLQRKPQPVEKTQLLYCSHIDNHNGTSISLSDPIAIADMPTSPPQSHTVALIASPAASLARLLAYVRHLCASARKHRPRITHLPEATASHPQRGRPAILPPNPIRVLIASFWPVQRRKLWSTEMWGRTPRRPLESGGASWLWSLR